MKWLSIAVAKYVRRYRRVCRDVCAAYEHPYVRELCNAICIRFVHRCDPHLGEYYVQCREYAIEMTRRLVERIRDRVTV